MYRVILVLMLVVSIEAKMIDAVAVVVQNQAITLYEIKEEMKLQKVDEKRATAILIRQKLELAEIKNRNISVDTADVYEDIVKTAKQNHMNVEQFYDAIRNSSGLTSTQVKKKVKQKLLTQKLYTDISYASMYKPSQTEIEDYYKLHIKEFSQPDGFDVVIYTSKDKNLLNTKLSNPMMLIDGVQMKAQTLHTDVISTQLTRLLNDTKVDSFTPILPNGIGGYMSFYLTKILDIKTIPLEKVKNKIINMIMFKTRQQILDDYFARLKLSAEITKVRTLESLND